MSSSLTRSRSLRKPLAGQLGQKEDADSSQEAQNNARNVSPSRLPVKGMTSSSTSRTTRAASTAASKSEDSDANVTRTARSRPISGVFGLGRSASVRQPPAQSASSSTATTTTTTVSRPPITTRNRPPAARPTSSSGPSPAISRPTSSSGLPTTTTSTAATAPPPRGHARTRSSATTLTTTTILRPPSQTSTSTTSTSPAAALEKPPSRPPPPPSRLHARAKSVSTASTTSSTSNNPVLLRKPAFTTLQQHFSPARNLAPKPLTATYLAPPSPSKLPVNIALSAETARLQTEVLQLHLLHRGCVAFRREWEGSARVKLGIKFERVVGMDKAVREEEGRVVEGGNVAALVEWGGGRGERLEERVRELDAVLGVVWGVGERGGRYSRVVRRFESWAEALRGVVRRRGKVGEDIVFVADLDKGWKEDCEGLVRKLGECRGVLGRIGMGSVEGREGSSSLARILGGLRALVDGMLAELELMLDIEREAVWAENEWVRAMNREGDGGCEDDNPGHGAIWRVF